MIALGREAQKLDLALMVGSTDVEMMPESSFKKGEIKEIKKRIAESKVRNPKMFDMVKKGSVPIVSQIYLGTGDLAFPSMLAVIMYYVHWRYHYCDFHSTHIFISNDMVLSLLFWRFDYMVVMDIVHDNCEHKHCCKSDYV